MKFHDGIIKTTSILVLALCLSACGGGSTNAPDTIIDQPASTPPPPPSSPDANLVQSFKTAEFNRSWGLDAINAAEAYALGFSGEDILIAVVDFNFDLATNELNLHPDSVGANPDHVAVYEAQIGEPRENSPHGHAVAVTAAGTKNDSGIHGVAFDAQVLAVDFFSGVYTRQVVQDGIVFTVSDPWSYAWDRGARIFNKSFGFDEDDIIQNPPVVSVAYAIEFDTTAVALGGLVVSSAGNNSDPEPSLSNLEALQRLSQAGILNQGPGAYVIVGSVDEDLTLSSFSDAAGAGESRFHFIVAPGGQVTFPWTEGLVVGSGTSFAAPHVSGAAAVILSRWPSLTAREVADIMFETATDLGAPGIDAVYGNGLLNLEAALQPVGQAKLAVQGAPPQAVTETALHLPPAFGDAYGLTTALSEVMILDAFERDFFVDAGGLVTSNGGRNNIEARFDARRNWQSANLSLTSSGSLHYALSTDKYSTPTFALAGQAEQDFRPKVDAVFEFAAQTAKRTWFVGTGRSLSSALAREPFAEASIGGFSLTGTGDTALPLGRGPYIAVNQPLSEDTSFSIGVSRSRVRGEDWHPLASLQQDSEVTAFATRLVQHSTKTRASVEIGASVEKGSLLGGRAAGGLQFGSDALTGWLTVSGGWHLSRDISIEGSGTVAITNGSDTGQGLINGISSITSSAFKLAATLSDFLSKSDQIHILFHQPLKVEKATAAFVTGIGLNPETGAVTYSERHISLAPRGREIAVEVGYRYQLNGWDLETNAAFRRDAGHFHGRNDALFAFNIAKRF